MTATPIGYRMRPASPDDLPAIAEVLLADDVEDTGQSVYDAAFVRDQWAVPGFDPADDGRLVLGPGDLVVGFGNVLPEGGARVKSWGVVHPQHRGLGIGSALFDWIEARASERLGGVVGATFEHSINDVDEGARAIVHSRALTLVRSFRHMQIDLDGPRDPGTPPAGIEIRGIRAEADLRQAHAIFVEAFRDEWGYRVIPFEEWRALEVGIAGFDPSLWLLATEGGQGVGALNASLDADRGWIGELAVLHSSRRRGIGSALLRRSFATFAERGTPRVLLNVDFENPTGAMRLYEQVGMRAVRGFNVYEKAIG
jgi:mycothiol synthase